MKIEYKLFLGVGIFFAVVGMIYGLWSHWSEPVGAVALFLSAALGAMISFYLWVTGRRLPLRPDDNPEATIDEQQGDYGFFSPHSWWPLFLGLSAAVTFLGLAVGWWLSIIGATFGAVALVGWTFEYFKGEYAL